MWHLCGSALVDGGRRGCAHVGPNAPSEKLVGREGRVQTRREERRAVLSRGAGDVGRIGLRGRLMLLPR